MTELLTAAQMRAIEQAAIESGEVTGLELMERAGQGVVEAIIEEWPELDLKQPERGASPSRSPGYLGPDERDSLRAVVLCGPGNNGGDGFVVARLLKERGWEVEVFLYGDAEKLPPDARVNFERWGEMGEVIPLTFKAFRKSHPLDNEQGYANVYVDALFGTGLTRPLEGEAQAVIHHMSGINGDRYDDRTVAVDAPSGICLDSGRWLFQMPASIKDLLGKLPDDLRAGLAEPGEPEPSLQARITVTFDSPKVGHFVGAGTIHCGRVVIKDIGLERWRCFKSPFVMTENGPVGAQRQADICLTGQEPIVEDRRNQVSYRFAAEWLGKSGRPHKYAHGHALVLSGGHGNTGAARLAARGALRIGAGLVTLGSPRSAMFENAANLTAVMLRQIDGSLGLIELLEDARFNAVCLGPGLGIRADTQAMVLTVLKENRPTVLDADALTRFSAKPEVLFEVLHKDCVITPHGGEFARLFPDIAERLDAPAFTGPAYSKVDATREAAARAGCVVLFKGPDTVIADPDGRCSINSAQYERSAPWLATAGSGDVLAGFITGLMARGFAPMQAAETAAWLHVECARKFGPGLIAEDLPEQLPAVFRDLDL